MQAKTVFKTSAAAIAMAASLTATGLCAESYADNLRALFDSREIPVTVDNFVRAATEIEMGKYLSLTKGVNMFLHVRQPTPVDMQPTIRMNRDTLYSMAVVDISQGATLTVPDPGDRYVTAMIVNQDHFINDVFYGGGTFSMDVDKFDTPYVIVIFRFLVDASDPEDVAEVNALQDLVTLEAGSAKPFIKPHYDEDTFDQTLNAALELSRSIPDSTRTFGAKEAVDPVRHFLGTAFGWGGLPEKEAFYLTEEPGLPIGEYKIDVPADVPVDAFWSISLYNGRGFFEENAEGAYNVNSVNGVRNADGGVTVHLGGCQDGRENCLPIMEGWNYTVRLYRPHPDVIDGSWTFPGVEPVK